MRKRFHFGKVAVVSAVATVLFCLPATAQTNGHFNHSNMRVNSSPGASGPRAKPLPPRTNTGAQSVVNRNQTGPGRTNTTTTTTTQHCDNPRPQYYDNYNGYRVPVYPGPNAPLPPTGGYYDPYGYYNNGYYNNGYYNNGYYNDGSYYDNGYYDDGYNNSGFPPFQGY